MKSLLHVVLHFTGILTLVVNFSGAVLRKTESGICSWYGDAGEIPPGWPTASGDGFDRFAMETAHKTLPFGTIVRVKNKASGKTVDVRVNDRGPFIAGRILDLTYAAFGVLEERDVGLMECSYVILHSNPDTRPTRPNSFDSNFKPGIYEESYHRPQLFVPSTTVTPLDDNSFEGTTTTTTTKSKAPNSVEEDYFDEKTNSLVRYTDENCNCTCAK